METLGYLVDPVPPPRVSPTIGLGRIGCGCGRGGGFVAMLGIVGLIDQGDYPSHDFGHAPCSGCSHLPQLAVLEKDRAEAERSRKPTELPSIEISAVAHMKREVAMNRRQL